MKFTTPAILLALLMSSAVATDDPANAVNKPNQDDEQESGAAHQGLRASNKAEVTIARALAYNPNDYCAPEDQVPLAITLVTDLYPWRLSWELFDPGAGAYPGRTVKESPPFNQPFHHYQKDVELCGNSCYNLELKNSAGQGLGAYGVLRLTAKPQQGEERPIPVFLGPNNFGSSKMFFFCMPSNDSPVTESPVTESPVTATAYNVYAVNNCGTDVKVKFKLRDSTDGHVINGQKYTSVTKNVPTANTVYIGQCDRMKQTFKKTDPSSMAESYKKRLCQGNQDQCNVDLCP